MGKSSRLGNYIIEGIILGMVLLLLITLVTIGIPDAFYALKGYKSKNSLSADRS